MLSLSQEWKVDQSLGSWVANFGFSARMASLAGVFTVSLPRAAAMVSGNLAGCAVSRVRVWELGFWERYFSAASQPTAPWGSIW